MKTNLKKVLAIIANRYNLSKKLLKIKHIYIGQYYSTWYAIIVEHEESNSCYFANWYDENYSRIETKQYKDINNPKALNDLYKFIIA